MWFLEELHLESGLSDRVFSVGTTSRNLPVVFSGSCIQFPTECGQILPYVL